MMKKIVIGTAGHIDHGKTALIKALTGIDCDRLKEEKDNAKRIVQEEREMMQKKMQEEREAMLKKIHEAKDPGKKKVPEGKDIKKKTL